MSPLLSTAAATAAFVGSHFLLSHPLRAPLAGRLGEKGFAGLYSLVAFATLGWMIAAQRSAGPEQPLWTAPDWAWPLGAAVMLIASILLVGSLVGNPALPGSTARPAGTPRGVYAITRHPMMWSFALWAGVHILVLPRPTNLVVDSGILVLALVGAAAQDAKKQRLDRRWPDWRRRTAFVPFAAQLSGRLPWRSARPQTIILAGGTLVWLLASWAHAPLGGWSVGLWR